MELLRKTGLLGSTARLRRINDLATRDIKAYYAAHGLQNEFLYAPIMVALDRGWENRTAALARGLGLSKASVSQTLAKMLHEGLVIETLDQKDRRSKVFSLTSKGQNVCEQMRPIWEKAALALADLERETQIELDHFLSKMEAALDRKPLIERLSRP